MESKIEEEFADSRNLIITTFPLPPTTLYQLNNSAMKTNLTLADFLHEQELVELEAARAYPGNYTDCLWPDTSDQKLYTCTIIFLRLDSTCYNNEDQSPVVFCESCAIKCHPEHQDLVDLFDKRGYKCDCGTSTTAHECSFSKSKKEITNDNIYSQNLLNIYCYCKAAYIPETVIMTS